MKKLVMVLVCLLSVQAFATSTMWIGETDSSTPIEGAYTLAPGASHTFAVYCTTNLNATAVNFMLGYAKSTLTTAGTSGAPVVGSKLEMVSTASGLNAWLDANLTSKFGTTQNARFGTSREASALLGGNTYGVDVGFARGVGAPETTLKLLEFTVKNLDASIAAPGYLVLTNSTSGTSTSFTSVVKAGTTYERPSFNMSIVPEPVSLVLLALGGLGLLRRRS